MRETNIIKMDKEGTATCRCHFCQKIVKVHNYLKERQDILEFNMLSKSELNNGWPHVLCENCYTSDRTENIADWWARFICANEPSYSIKQRQCSYDEYDDYDANYPSWWYKRFGTGYNMGFSSYSKEGAGLSKLRELVKKYSGECTDIVKVEANNG